MIILDSCGNPINPETDPDEYFEAILRSLRRRLSSDSNRDRRVGKIRTGNVEKIVKKQSFESTCGPAKF